MRVQNILLLSFFVSAFFAPLSSSAAQLLMLRDTLSTSVPGKSASHTIEFVNTQDIPESGEIRVRFDGAGAPFLFPPLFDYTHVGVDVWRGAGYESFVIDAISDLATSSAGLFLIGDGEVRVRLPADAPYMIPAGSRVRVRIGAGVAETNAILNPNVAGSHRFTIVTYDSSENEIDRGIGIVTTITPVTIGAIYEGTAAIIKNDLPKGLLPGGTAKVYITFETNLPAYCRYSNTPDVPYESMPTLQSFKSSNFNRLHFLTVDTEDDRLYKYFVRCFTRYGLTPNTEDYPIEFEVGVIPKEKRPPPPPPGTQSGNNTGGGNQLFQSGLTIDGKTFSGALVSIMMDGKELRTLNADGQGYFNTVVSDIDRGTYTFGITAIDADKNRSTTYSTTIAVTGATRNSIGPVFLSPTAYSKTPQIDVGMNVLAQGKAIPLQTVQAVVIGAKDPLQQPYALATTTANGSGDWSLLLETNTLPKGTYAIRAQTLVPGQGNSQFSPEFLLGIGEKPQGDNRKRSDINGDGKVNLADLSILLFNWRKSNPTADINSDGIVNIVDFSIMLSAWTG